MADNPLILALAFNLVPEITPDEAKAVRPDAIVCTGPLRLSKSSK